MNLFDRIRDPLVSQGLLGLGTQMLAASERPGGTLGGALSQGILGFQGGYESAKKKKKEEERRERIQGLLGDTLPDDGVGPVRPGLLNTASPIEAIALEGAAESGDYASLLDYVNDSRTASGFSGTGIEAQMLNSYLNTIPPEQRESVKNDLVAQRLGRPQTVVTPTGTYITPGYNLGAPSPAAPENFVKKKPTEGEVKDSYVSDSLITAENKISGLLSDPDFNPASARHLAGKVGNIFSTPKYRQYKSVADEWTTNIVFLRSGATAREEEKTSAMQNFFPQVGDDDATIQFKNQLRVDQMRNAIHKGREAGRISKEQANKELKKLESMYSGDMKTIDGKTYIKKNGQWFEQ